MTATASNTGAAERLAALAGLGADDLCASAETALEKLVDVMNQETTLLRTGRFREAAGVAADKARLAHDYVHLARAVQHGVERLRNDAPAALERLHRGHERLAAQMAENLKVLATARSVTEDILADVAGIVGRSERARTYGAGGGMTTAPDGGARGLAINRAL